MACTKAVQCVTMLGLAEMSSSVCFQEMEVRHHTPGAGLVRLIFVAGVAEAS